MAKYILVKKVKGKKYEYQVIDVDSKAIVSKERPPVIMWRVPPTENFILGGWT